MERQAEAVASAHIALLHHGLDRSPEHRQMCKQRVVMTLCPLVCLALLCVPFGLLAVIPDHGLLAFSICALALIGSHCLLVGGIAQ